MAVFLWQNPYIPANLSSYFSPNLIPHFNICIYNDEGRRVVQLRVPAPVHSLNLASQLAVWSTEVWSSEAPACLQTPNSTQDYKMEHKEA